MHKYKLYILWIYRTLDILKPIIRTHTFSTYLSVYHKERHINTPNAVNIGKDVETRQQARICQHSQPRHDRGMQHQAWKRYDREKHGDINKMW